MVHHPALPYADMPGFMASLKLQQGVAPRALEFVIFCASRTSEVAGARWKEVDLDAAVWEIPAARMKAKRNHRVALCDQTIKILKEMDEIRESDSDDAYIFPGGRIGKPLSENAMLEVIERMGRTGITVHGFRSSFKDWASESTSFDNIVSESALAHAIGDDTEAAYRRSDLFDKRRKLMDAWASYCSSSPDI